MESEKTRELVTALEDLLVKELRILQTLVTITRDERKALLNNDLDQIAKLVEEKEVLLDQIGLAEDNRRKYTAQLSTELNVPLEGFALSDLFPKIDPESAQRLSRLSEGIYSLAGQMRELNQWNRSYASTTLEWLDAAQSYLLRLFAPEKDGYGPSGTPQSVTAPVSLDRELRA